MGSILHLLIAKYAKAWASIKSLSKLNSSIIQRLDFKDFFKVSRVCLFLIPPQETITLFTLNLSSSCSIDFAVKDEIVAHASLKLNFLNGTREK